VMQPRAAKQFLNAHTLGFQRQKDQATKGITRQQTIGEEGQGDAVVPFFGNATSDKEKNQLQMKHPREGGKELLDLYILQDRKVPSPLR